MDEALVARVRYHIQKANFMGLKDAESTLLLAEAADAIEELQRYIDGLNGVCSDNDALCKRIDELSKELDAMNEANIALHGALPKWIPFKTRPMDEEEREYYKEHTGYDLTDDEAVIYVSQLPEHGQDVLVCSDRGGVWLDTFDDDPKYGIGFEGHGDMDGVAAWMPLPEPYEPPKKDEVRE